MSLSCFFFFNDTATTEIYTLSLHDALPISMYRAWESERADALFHDPYARRLAGPQGETIVRTMPKAQVDRKSTRLNSSHSQISYAVFCLKKKKKKQTTNY